ncbi:hypothetical protein ACFL02_05530 [Planctomycetota bacterium]
MLDDYEPITEIGKNHGCMYCGSKTDKFYFIEYYMLPRRLTRKRHREKERFVLICQSCYESNRLLVISIDGRPFVVFKAGYRDMNNLKCVICKGEIKQSQIYGVISLLHMMGGSGIESKPLAFLCSNCIEKHVLEL